MLGQKSKRQIRKEEEKRQKEQEQKQKTVRGVSFVDLQLILTPSHK